VIFLACKSQVLCAKQRHFGKLLCSKVIKDKNCFIIGILWKAEVPRKFNLAKLCQDSGV
jgi:hypothetical protein